MDIPHYVWHFLSDADIRVKDVEYRARDQAAIAEVIAALEQGALPDTRH